MGSSIDVQLEAVSDAGGRRWAGDPVWVAEGSPAALRKLIPQFERRPLSLGHPGLGTKSELPSGTFVANGENELADLIVRLPLNNEEIPTPVAAVSKTYKLVQHTDLFERAYGALKSASVDVRQVSGELTLSAYRLANEMDAGSRQRTP